jgi:hypothetical protein
MEGIIESFVPISPGEAADRLSMLRFTSEIRAVVEEACDIEHARWEAIES